MLEYFFTLVRTIYLRRLPSKQYRFADDDDIIIPASINMDIEILKIVESIQRGSLGQPHVEVKFFFQLFNSAQHEAVRRAHSIGWIDIRKIESGVDKYMLMSLTQKGREEANLPVLAVSTARDEETLNGGAEAYKARRELRPTLIDKVNH